MNRTFQYVYINIGDKMDWIIVETYIVAELSSVIKPQLIIYN